MTRQMPPPRPSGHTLIGLEAVANGDHAPPHREHMRDERKTPESGLQSLPAHMQQMTERELAMFALERWQEAEQQEIRREHERRNREREREALRRKDSDRIDGLILEVRSMVTEMRSERATVKQLDEQAAASQMLQQHTLSLLVELQKAVVVLDTKLGDGPADLDHRSSLVGEMTKEQVEELEKKLKAGRGALGALARVVSTQDKHAKRLAFGAAFAGGLAGASPAIVMELIKFFTS